jgi:hypothetical protein
MNKTHRLVLSAVLTALLLPAFTVSQTPPKAKARWVTLEHFSGKDIKNTDDFVIKEPKWRIRWELKSRPDNLNIFQVYVYTFGRDGKPTPALPNFVAANVTQGTDSDSSVMRGAGKYYLQINTMQEYELWVEEWVES